MSKKTYQRYTPEFKEQALALLVTGKPVAEVALGSAGLRPAPFRHPAGMWLPQDAANGQAGRQPYPSKISMRRPRVAD